MNALSTRILLATDGSEDAAFAARVATDLSRRTESKLYVAHAWRPAARGFGYPAVMWTDYSHLYEREARRLLERGVREIEARGVSAEPRLLHGPPVEAILDLCEELEPGLVVVGSRGRGPIGRLLLGSVAEGVVHHARFPVLVARGGAWPPERIVVGDDGSDDAGRAARLALGIGDLYGVEGVLVRAYHNPPEPIGGWSADDRRRLDEAAQREQEAADERAEKLGRHLTSDPKVKVREGDAALSLLVVAEEGSEERTLLAVGSRGLGPIRRLRLGSVSTDVLRAASGPVLIFPHAVRKAAEREARKTAAAVHPSGE
ncbi:MAG TPA: universal stress protein [Rubrobacteraceae bacterium]|nr:universal stress protein [Rubrobacteraceae bacterium]